MDDREYQKNHETKVYLMGDATSQFHDIKPGSAVCIEELDEGVVLWYEGDIYDSGRPFDEMAKSAVGRMRQHYPTVAKTYASKEGLGEFDLAEVGVMDKDYHYTPIKTACVNKP